MGQPLFSVSMYVFGRIEVNHSGSLSYLLNGASTSSIYLSIRPQAGIKVSIEVGRKTDLFSILKLRKLIIHQETAAGAFACVVKKLLDSGAEL